MKKIIILIVSILFVYSGFTQNKEKIYKPKDLPIPVLDSTGFIIDPDNKIIEDWYNEMIRTRETYFFCRYIEPICVRVDNISSPDDPEKYADELIKIWDLEKKTNGRFVFQLMNKSNQKAVFRVGSKLKIYYLKSFLDDLADNIEEVHLVGKANGTGDFVAMQKLGDNIFMQIKFDSKLTTYEGNTGKHSIYPDRIDRSNGELKTLAESYYADNDPIFIETPDSENYEGESSEQSSEKNYFSGISQLEIDKNFSAINTNGSITLIENVPNAREINNTHITDPHNMLSDFAEDTINKLLDELELTKGYQVAVVCLNSIGDNDPRTWGTDLFNLWGIGSKEKEDGLLMLLIHDIHGIDFITGRGTEGILTDVDCYNIQQEEMVPYFKQNDYATGMIRGTQAVCDFFYGSPPIYSTQTVDDGYEEDYSYEEYYDYKPVPFWETAFFKFYATTTIILFAAWFFSFVIAFFIPDLHKRYHILKFFNLLIWPILFPIPFAILFFVNKMFMTTWRNTIRFSPKTGEEMHKLDDHAEDKHLVKGQLSEEKVKSIDYDVWITYRGDDVLILSYKKWFSKYNKCPKCSFKTYFKAYDKTITSATYTSTGTGERCYKCENCGYSKTERYTIPMKTKSSGSSSGSSSYRSGGSSYSSGGSSYGGGSSRGGGSGSRW